MATIDWTARLAEQLTWHWEHHLRPGLDGLTDDEYGWEPVPGMWSIRPHQESTAPIRAGSGEGAFEFAVPEPTPAPLTTIAWRIGHLCDVMGERAANHFGGPPVSYQETDWPLTAAGGLDLLDRCYDSWMAGQRALDAAGLAAPCGPAEGPWADAPIADLVLNIHREVIHHGAEVLVLRDLYRRRGELNGERS